MSVPLGYLNIVNYKPTMAFIHTGKFKMGCDIHLFLEVRIDERWEHAGEIDVDRSYELFGLMAGVRSEAYEPVSWPKGLPDSINPMTTFYMRHAQHDFSWLDYKEIAELYTRIVAIGNENSLRYKLRDILNTNYPSTEIRLVFGFDS
jgi:hypothetical protein